MDFADYLETQFRDWMSQGTDLPTAPATVYVALHTGDPSDSGGDNEVAAGDYSREGVTAGSGWDTPAGNEFENANEVRWGEATNDWGTISHVSLWDSQSDGNALAAYALADSKVISSGDEAVFRAGELAFSID